MAAPYKRIDLGGAVLQLRDLRAAIGNARLALGSGRSPSVVMIHLGQAQRAALLIEGDISRANAEAGPDD